MKKLWRYYISTSPFDTGGVVYAENDAIAIERILCYYRDDRLTPQDVGVWLATEDDDYDTTCPDVLMVY